MTTIYFRHWVTGKELSVTGNLLPNLNNASSDRYVLQIDESTYVDIIKSTVIRMEKVNDSVQV